MQTTRENLLAWLRTVLRETGQAPSTLATNAGVAPSTINRFMDEDGGGLRSDTIEKIVNYSGIPLEVVPSQRKTAGLREPDAEPFTGPAAAPQSAASQGDIWVLRSPALVDIGYMPGDFVRVDGHATPKPGDIICAQLYDAANGTARTIMRQYLPPYLVARSPESRFAKPVLTEADRVTIMGTVVESWRHREADRWIDDAPKRALSGPDAG